MNEITQPQPRKSLNKPTRRRAKTALLWCILIVFTLIACILILEIGSRLILGIRPGNRAMLTPHHQAIYTLNPGFHGLRKMRGKVDGEKDIAIGISPQGLRGASIPEKSPGEFRVLFLGDSYTFGWALDLEDTFIKDFEAKAGSGYTALNAGVPGYGPWQERIFLNERGFPLDPDLVVFQAYISNDIDDTLLKTGDHLDAYFVERREYLLRHLYAEYWQVRLDNFTRRRSAFSTIIYERIAGKQLVLTRILNKLRIFGQVPLPQYLPSADRLWSFEPDLKQWYPKLEEGWKLMCEDIRGIRADCESRGVRFAAFAIPTSINAASDLSHTDPRYEIDKGTNRLEEFFANEGIDFLPFKDLLRAHPDPDSLYFHGDGHINEDGARLLGEALAAWIPELRASVQPPVESR